MGVGCRAVLGKPAHRRAGQKPQRGNLSIVTVPLLSKPNPSGVTCLAPNTAWVKVPKYYGVGLTPAGREKEAEVGQMLASASAAFGVDLAVGQRAECPDVVGLLRRTAALDVKRET
jgi:hypothetical protein